MRSRRLADVLTSLIFAGLCLTMLPFWADGIAGKLLSRHATEVSMVPLAGLAVMTILSLLRKELELAGLRRFLAWSLAVYACLALSIIIHPASLPIEEYPHGRARFIIWQLRSLAWDFGWSVLAAYIIYLRYRTRGGELVRLASRGFVWAVYPILAVALVELAAKTGVLPELLGGVTRVAEMFSAVSSSTAVSAFNVFPERIRSLFYEPSYLGNWGAVALPFVACRCLKCERGLVSFSAIVFLMLVSTSRSAVVSLSAVLTAIAAYAVYARRIDALKRLAIGAAVSMTLSAALLSTHRLGIAHERTAETKMTAANEFASEASDPSEVLDFSFTAGATSTRYLVCKTDLRIASAYDFLGCGYGVRGIVFGEHYVGKVGEDAEIDGKLKRQSELGRVKSPFMALSTWTVLLAEHGIIGLGAYLIPFIAALLVLTRRSVKRRSVEDFAIIAGLLGFLVASLATYMPFALAPWLLLGMACCGRRRRRESLPLSCVTATYNVIAAGRREALIRAVRSVGKLPLEHEHLIFDGGSTDGTVELLKELARENPSLVIVSERDSGIYAALNKGVKAARGEWFYVLGCDDYIHEPRRLAEALDREEDADFILSPVVYSGEATTKLKWKPESFLCNAATPHQGSLMRTAVVRALGGFDERYRIIADVDLMQRVVFAGYRVARYARAYAVFALSGVSGNAQAAGVEYQRLAAARFVLTEKERSEVHPRRILPLRVLIKPFFSPIPLVRAAARYQILRLMRERLRRRK